jgi:cell division protein FtsB
MATFKGGAVVYAQFARQLETELAAVTAERDAIAAENAQLKRYIQGSDNE